MGVFVENKYWMLQYEVRKFEWDYAWYNYMSLLVIKPN